MRVYLDDERKTPDGWERTYSVRETIDLLASGLVTHLSLDHDLGHIDPLTGKESTGYDVLLWIEEQTTLDPMFMPPHMQVHSDNASAVPKMLQAIRQIEKIFSRR